jgi:hypothetical protein
MRFWRTKLSTPDGLIQEIGSEAELKNTYPEEEF